MSENKQQELISTILKLTEKVHNLKKQNYELIKISQKLTDYASNNNFASQSIAMITSELSGEETNLPTLSCINSFESDDFSKSNSLLKCFIEESEKIVMEEITNQPSYVKLKTKQASQCVSPIDRHFQQYMGDFEGLELGLNDRSSLQVGMLNSISQHDTDYSVSEVSADEDDDENIYLLSLHDPYSLRLSNVLSSGFASKISIVHINKIKNSYISLHFHYCEEANNLCTFVVITNGPTCLFNCPFFQFHSSTHKYQICSYFPKYLSVHISNIYYHLFTTIQIIQPFDYKTATSLTTISSISNFDTLKCFTIYPLMTFFNHRNFERNSLEVHYQNLPQSQPILTECAVDNYIVNKQFNKSTDQNVVLPQHDETNAITLTRLNYLETKLIKFDKENHKALKTNLYGMKKAVRSNMTSDNENMKYFNNDDDEFSRTITFSAKANTINLKDRSNRVTEYSDDILLSQYMMPNSMLSRNQRKEINRLKRSPMNYMRNNKYRSRSSIVTHRWVDKDEDKEIDALCRPLLQSKTIDKILERYNVNSKEYIRRPRSCTMSKISSSGDNHTRDKLNLLLNPNLINQFADLYSQTKHQQRVRSLRQRNTSEVSSHHRRMTNPLPCVSPMNIQHLLNIYSRNNNQNTFNNSSCISMYSHNDSQKSINSPYFCNKCKEKFSLASDLRRHIRKFHKQFRVYC